MGYDGFAFSFYGDAVEPVGTSCALRRCMEGMVTRRVVMEEKVKGDGVRGMAMTEKVTGDVALNGSMDGKADIENHEESRGVGLRSRDNSELGLYTQYHNILSSIMA